MTIAFLHVQTKHVALSSHRLLSIKRKIAGYFIG